MRAFLILWAVLFIAGLALASGCYIAGYNMGVHNGCVWAGGRHCN